MFTILCLQEFQVVGKILIFYGSKDEFEKSVPIAHRNLTDLVYEADKESKIFTISIGDQKQQHEEKKIEVKNFVATSDEYAGVREHVIINFVNFLAKFDIENLYLHNPPLQISNQIKQLFPNADVKYQKYAPLTIDNLKTLNEKYDSQIIGQSKVKAELLQALFPLTLENRRKPVVLLFYGSSGIGKTETAKYLADLVNEELFRKQFSMFQNVQFSTYLFGGAHYEKSFAKDLLDRKSNVILLDEFDKAHSSFHSAFYQLFDEGVFEDQNYFLTLDRSVIICTSNYSSLKEIEEQLGSAIYNRFDSLIKFSDLSSESKTIIGNTFYNQLKTDYGFDLPIEELESLQHSFVKFDNARQIKRIVEQTFALFSIKSAITKPE